MLYLIDENFKVIGKGKALGPNKKAGEFVLHSSAGKAALKEVAKVNDVEVGKKDSVETLIKKIEVNFNKKEIPIMSEKETEKTELEVKCEGIVKTGLEAGKDDDAIQVELVGAGLKFKQAASAFKQLSESLGFRVAAKDRMAKVVEILEGYIPESWDDVTNAAENLAKKIDDTTEAQAIACLRKVCKDAEKEFPKKPKGSDGKPRGFKATMFKWMSDNKECTRAEMDKFLDKNDQKPVYKPYYWSWIEFARAFAK